MDYHKIRVNNVAQIVMKYPWMSASDVEWLFGGALKGTCLEVGNHKFFNFDLSRIHDRFCGVVLAPRESGKTSLSYQLIASKSYIPRGHVTSTTDGTSPFWSHVFGRNNVTQVYSPETQFELAEIQEMRAQKYTAQAKQGKIYDPRLLVVEEDCAYDKHVRTDSGLDKIATSGRHFHMGHLIILQKLKTVSPTYRENADFIVLASNIENPEMRKQVWQEYAGFLSFDYFVYLLRVITSEPFRVMIISSRGIDRGLPPNERIFFFKAIREEAVDCVLGGGKYSFKSGYVLKPPQVFWRVGPLREYKYNKVVEWKREGAEEEEPEPVFEPASYSITEAFKDREDDKKQQKIAEVATYTREIK